MCLGAPMTILEGDGVTALCARGDERRRVSMLLLGAQPPGTFVLAHIDTAVRVLDAEEARLIDDALQGLEAALRGEKFETHFADLIDREPQLPEHLR
jgi:hydrogenase expression/formation protein HypC